MADPNAQDSRTVIVRSSRHGVPSAVFAIRQAFTEFLTLPTLVVAGFLLLAAVMYAVDEAAIPGLQPLSHFLRGYLFGDPGATSSLLATIAGSIITVTSITFSLLLLAVQQSASRLTSQVYAQFFRRSFNQLYLGFFVGLALYTLIILATVNKTHNPVLGGAAALVLTLVALYFLVLLLYGAINQIRPSQVIEAIHDLTLTARAQQMPLVKSTRRVSECACPVRATARAGEYGFVTNIDLQRLKKPLQQTQGECEVIILMTIGSFVPVQGVLAEVKAADASDAAIVAAALPHALRLEASRDIKGDPAYGIDQLVTIAWTSVSSANQNLAPGTLTVHFLHDLLIHWCGQGRDTGDDQLPVVYPDTVLSELLDAFEALGVVSSRSLQYQVFAEIAQVFADTLERLPCDLQRKVEGLTLRLLSVLGDLPPTDQLDCGLHRLIVALRATGRDEVADKVERATIELSESIGQRGSRSTRVPRSGS